MIGSDETNHDCHSLSLAAAVLCAIGQVATAGQTCAAHSGCLPPSFTDRKPPVTVLLDAVYPSTHNSFITCSYVFIRCVEACVEISGSATIIS